MTHTASTETIPEVTASAPACRIVSAVEKADRRMLEYVLLYMAGHDRKLFAKAWERQRAYVIDSPDASDGSAR